MTLNGNKKYQVAMEIAGPSAMWTRPDTGSAVVSEVVPSWSAAKGIFESIARLRTAYINPTAVDICAPVERHRYTNNYCGPLRKTSQIRGGDPFQLPAVVLVNVCYRLYGEVEEASPQPGPTNHRHALQEMFCRRLEKGQFFRPVCLGWSEFIAAYAGPLRPETRAQEHLSLMIPIMLHSVFDRPVNGRAAPRFVRDQTIRNGRLDYAC